MQVSFKNFDKWVSTLQNFVGNLDSDADSLMQHWLGEGVDQFVKHGSADDIIQGISSSLYLASHSDGNNDNYVLSARNSYYGSLDGSVNANSLSALTSQIDAELNDAICEGLSANSHDAYSCNILLKLFNDSIAPLYETLTGYDSELIGIRATFAQNVALPSLVEAKRQTGEFYESVKAMAAYQTEESVKMASQKWHETMAAWQRCAAILSGPFTSCLHDIDVLQARIKSMAMAEGNDDANDIH